MDSPNVHIACEDDFYSAAFGLTSDGNLLETVTTKPGGRWNWDEACEVDIERADDPSLCMRIIALLTYMEEQYDIRKKEEAPQS